MKIFEADYQKRRAALRQAIGSGLILFVGNNEAPYNYPDNTYKYRQDSNFLYFFGISLPGLTGVIDADSGEEYIYGEDVSIDDIIWMGPQPTIRELAAQVKVEKTGTLADLKNAMAAAVKSGRKVHYVPAYRHETMIQLEDLLGIRIAELKANVSIDLIKAIVNLRSVKEACEIAEIERACDIGYLMHTTAMRMCKPGVVEQEIAGYIEGIACSYGATVSFPVILSQNGETLHNHNHGNVLEAGRLMLTDAGAETVFNYCSDFTRTIPVSGKFTQQQREIHDAVSAAHARAIEVAKPGITWREVHLEVCKTLATNLKAIGIMKGDIDEAVAAGAHALFMPHGLGHQMGMDVHDMEGIGQVYVGYDDEIRPSKQFGLASLRMGRRIQQGFVITDEPGCYFIPALIDKWKADKMHTDFINYDALDAYRTFGGIRLEDDVLITENGSRFLGQKRIPLTSTQIEEYMAENK